MSTLTDIIASHDSLVQQASLALPHDFSRCTYSLGPIRQAVYLCLTCALPRGICSACSIACHTNHEQIELFPKRNFRCDCPTRVLQHACTLHKVLEGENEENTYGQNFHAGAFCRCGRVYDALKERETMIQCLACEDWFHESCLNLRERPSSREPSPAADPDPPTAQQNSQPTDPTADEDDDAHSTSSASSSGLPPPLIPASSYCTFICASCVSSISTLTRYAGTPGVLMVVRDETSAPWKVLDSPDDPIDISSDDTATGDKRPRPSSPAGPPDPKRVRTSTSSPQPSSSILPKCLAPPPNTLAQSILTTPSSALGAGDIFLTEGWRERWCRCPACLPSLQAHPYLLDEEETYEPPQDPDSGLSLEELGMRALLRLPRDKAIDGIHAFNGMRDDLVKFLRPFAQEGREVKKSDVQAFFEGLKEGKRSGSGSVI